MTGVGVFILLAFVFGSIVLLANIYMEAKARRPIISPEQKEYEAMLDFVTKVAYYNNRIPPEALYRIPEDMTTEARDLLRKELP